MQNNDRDSDAIMSDRLYGEHYPDSFLDLPQPIRHSSLRTLGDYIGRLQEVGQQPHQSYVACVPAQPSFEHICPNNPILTCNCTDPKYCAELGDKSEQSSTFIKCPDSGKLCTRIDCPNGCKGDPTASRESALSSGSSSVSGVVCETRTTAGECVSRSEHSAGDTEQHTDAGHHNDGPAPTARL